MKRGKNVRHNIFFPADNSKLLHLRFFSSDASYIFRQQPHQLPLPTFFLVEQLIKDQQYNKCRPNSSYYYQLNIRNNPTNNRYSTFYSKYLFLLGILAWTHSSSPKHPNHIEHRSSYDGTFYTASLLVLLQ